MTHLKYLTYHGMTLRAYNALWRAGYHTVEDVLGTDPYEDTIAEGPEPLPCPPWTHGPNGEIVPPKVPPGRDNWSEYRWRWPWIDVRGLGVGSVKNIQEAVERYRRHNQDVAEMEKLLRSS